MDEEKDYKQKFTERFKDEWDKNHEIQSSDEDEDELDGDDTYYTIYYDKECKVIVVLEKIFEGYHHDSWIDILIGMYPSENGSFEDLLSHIDDIEWYFEED